MSDQSLEMLSRIEARLNALLGIAVDSYLRSNDDLAKPRPRSIDRMLTDFGLTGAEVARLLGKSPQAVSAILSKDAKTKKTVVSGASRIGQKIEGDQDNGE